MTATNDGIIHLKGRIRDGKLVALLDHEGKELGAPVTALESVTGRSRFSGVGPIQYDPQTTYGLKVALLGDSKTYGGQWGFPGTYSGVEKGRYNTDLVVTNLTSSFVVIAKATANCVAADTVTLAFDGDKYMTVDVAGEGAGAKVDVTGGGHFHLVSAGGVKGAIVYLRWRNKPATAKSDTTSSSLGTRYVHSIRPSCWAFGALAKNGYGHLDIRNYGIGGDTTTDVINRIGQIKAWAPDVAILEIGVNNYTESTVAEDIRTIVAELNSVGTFVIVSTVLARGSTTTTTCKQLLHIANKVKRLVLDGALRCRVYDGFSQTVVPSQSFGDAAVIASYYQTDLLHPGLLGTVQGIGPTLAPVLASIIPPLRPALSSRMDVYDATYNPYGNLIGNNGSFYGVAGSLAAGGSGTLASSWGDTVLSGTSTAVYTAPDDGSPVARTDGVAGNWQRVVFSATTTSGRQIQLPVSGITAGKKFRLHATVRISNATLINLFNVQVYQTVSSNGAATNVATQLDSLAAMASGTLTDSGALHISSQVMEAPAEITAAYFQFLYGCSAGGGMTLDIQDARIEFVD